MFIKVLLLAAFAAILACSGYEIHSHENFTPTQTNTSNSLFRTHGPAILNNLDLTPGAVSDLSQATLCSKTFHTGTVRNVTEATKLKACSEYGIAKSDCTGQKYEIDHLISLELGGSNDLTNLWPQPYFPKPGAKEKDTVENYLHRQVCSNKLTLAEAQKEISTDWYNVYLALQ